MYLKLLPICWVCVRWWADCRRISKIFNWTKVNMIILTDQSNLTKGWGLKLRSNMWFWSQFCVFVVSLIDQINLLATCLIGCQLVWRHRSPLFRFYCHIFQVWYGSLFNFCSLWGKYLIEINVDLIAKISN
jgi:hypothetical protein